jgi:hypothetical protein
MASGTDSFKWGGAALSPGSITGDELGLSEVVFERTGNIACPLAPGGARRSDEACLACGAGLEAREVCWDGGGDREKVGDGGP